MNSASWVKIQEAENQIITHYEVCEQRPADSTLLVPSLEQHVRQFGRVPAVVAADPGFFSAANEAKAEERGVRRLDSQSCYQKPGPQAAAKAALVQEATEMAHRMRGPHQCSEKPAWVGPIPIQRTRRHKAMGRARSDRRQCDSHRLPLGEPTESLIPNRSTSGITFSHPPLSPSIPPNEPSIPSQKLSKHSDRPSHPVTHLSSQFRILRREVVRLIEGQYLVGGTRVSLDSLVYLFREGMSAESRRTAHCRIATPAFEANECGIDCEAAAGAPRGSGSRLTPTLTTCDPRVAASRARN